MSLVDEVKQRKVFSGLPDSVVLRALEICGNDVKEARAFLRKYFGVFLTNKVVKGTDASVLKAHLSSKARDYEQFYSFIFKYVGSVSSVIDLGAGVNGFSIEALRDTAGDANYVGVEASEQLVRNLNEFFAEKQFSFAKAVHADLFELDFVQDLLSKEKRPRVVFLLQVVDALEQFEQNFSKRLLTFLAGCCEFVVVSLPTRSLGGRTKFRVDRKWLVDFLQERFTVLADRVLGSERVIVLSTRH